MASNFPVIVAAARTAIGNFNGSLASTSAASLGSTCIKALLQRSGVEPDQISEVVLGQVLQAGCGQNPARQSSLLAGIPEEVPSLTINKVCGSGLKSVMLAAESIIVHNALGYEEDRFIVAGGQENMSLSPRLFLNPRVPYRMGDVSLKDSMIMDGLWCAFNDYHMGITAENIVEKHSLSREEQDEFAFNSQVKANKAIADGKFVSEIVPVQLKDRKGKVTLFDVDEFPRKNITLESLQSLRPAFSKNGSVTAGNASGINDGAAALLVCSQKTAEKHSLPVLATIKSFASAGIDPKIMGLGVVPAVRQCLQRVNWDINEDVELIEANEAFAAQSLGVAKELGINPMGKDGSDRINVNGGAIALGHPIGASGARVLVTLIHELKRSGKKKGLATLCIGGGQGVAMAIEVPH